MGLKALVAFNQFKGSLTNDQACLAAAEALKRRKIETQVFPIGDGGRGTINAVRAFVEGKEIEIPASGPLNKPTVAKVLCFPNETKPTRVYVESAEVCGFHLVEADKQDALRATSRGLGELLSTIFSKWGSHLQEVLIGLGDSAICDSGMGMLGALGVIFRDKGGMTLWGNANSLRQIESIVLPRKLPWEGVRFTVLCDVLNPLCGPTGSAAIFSPQKGAKAGQVKLIEQGNEHFARKIREHIGKEVQGEPMTGAAGGLGAAFLAFFDAQLVHGAQYLLDWLSFDRLVEQSDVLLTGEGMTDSQTLAGKAPFEVVRRATQARKKTVLISGQLGQGYGPLENKDGVIGLFACGKEPEPKTALFNKTLEIFSDKKILEQLTER